MTNVIIKTGIELQLKEKTTMNSHVYTTMQQIEL